MIGPGFRAWILLVLNFIHALVFVLDDLRRVQATCIYPLMCTQAAQASGKFFLPAHTTLTKTGDGGGDAGRVACLQNVPVEYPWHMGIAGQHPWQGMRLLQNTFPRPSGMSMKVKRCEPLALIVI